VIRDQGLGFKTVSQFHKFSSVFVPVIMPERGVKKTRTTCAISVALSIKVFVGMTAETSCDISGR
jgi:hypothetical protein